jgi:N-acetylglucosamine malate deacetylase 1
LVEDACYLAGLERLDNYLAAHRSVRVVFASGDTQVQPTFVVDITEQFEGKLEAVRKHTALFSDEKEFLAGVEARARYSGALIGVKFGEPFVERGPREGALL